MTQKFDVLLFSLFPETLTLSSSCRLLLPDRGVQVPDTEVQRNSKQGVLLAAVPGLHSHCAAPALYSTSVLDDTAVYNISHSTAVILVLV